MYLSLVEAFTWDYERNEIVAYECAHRWSVQPVWGLLIKHLNCCLKPYCVRWHQKDFIIDSSKSSSSNHPNHHVSAFKSWDGFISMDIFYSTKCLIILFSKSVDLIQEGTRGQRAILEKSLALRWHLPHDYYYWYLNTRLYLPTVKP